MTLLRSQPRHSVRPSLLLDFANGKTLDPRIDFTRASTASFYDGETYAKAEENLFEYSQEFDESVWSKGSLSITSTTETAPDGTSTASKIVPTASAHAYVGTTDDITPSNVYGYINLTTGVLTIQSGGLDSSTVIDVFGDQSWWRIAVEKNGYFMSFYAKSAGYIYASFQLYNVARMGVSNVASIFASSPNGTDGILIWGAQLEQRDSLTAYTPTTDQPITNYIPVLQTAQNNQARFDHDPVTEESLGLLIEEQRTNLVTYSEDFSDSSWLTNNAIKQADVIIAPDGSLTGGKVIADATNGRHRTQDIFGAATAGDVYTGTVYLKSGEYTTANVRVGRSGISESIDVDLTNGSITREGSAVQRSSATDVGNGWYRLSITVEIQFTDNFQFLVIGPNLGDSTNYTGDGYSGVYLWGAQVEQGSFPTSYIPTSGSTATRNAEFAIMTGDNFSSWYSQGQGTMYCDATCIEPYAGTNEFPRAWEMQGADGSTSNNVIRDVYGVLSGFTDHRPSIRKNNELQASFDTVAETNGNKTALAWKTDDVAYANGGNLEDGTDTSAGIPVVSRLLISAFNPASGGIGNSYTRKIAYYPQRLTNEELQRLTEA